MTKKPITFTIILLPIAQLMLAQFAPQYQLRVAYNASDIPSYAVSMNADSMKDAYFKVPMEIMDVPSVGNDEPMGLSQDYSYFKEEISYLDCGDLKSGMYGYQAADTSRRIVKNADAAMTDTYIEMSENFIKEYLPH